MNISTNLKAIDMIKGEILSEIAHLYRTLADYDEIGDYESVTNEIATVIAMDYILARRLGIGYASIDKKISELLVIGGYSNIRDNCGDNSILCGYFYKK